MTEQGQKGTQIAMHQGEKLTNESVRRSASIERSRSVVSTHLVFQNVYAMSIGLSSLAVSLIDMPCLSKENVFPDVVKGTQSTIPSNTKDRVCTDLFILLYQIAPAAVECQLLSLAHRTRNTRTTMNE